MVHDNLLVQQKDIHLTAISLLQVAEKKQTLKNVTDYIVNIILKRADFSYNYGVILIPEGLIDFIPEVLFLIINIISSSFSPMTVLTNI